MKTMTCKQLGGACDKEFSANTFDEISEMSKQHGMEMFMSGDEAHLEVMKKVQALMTDPNTMNEWIEEKRKEFEVLPEC